MKTKNLLIATVTALALVPSLSMAQGFGHYPQRGAYDQKPQQTVNTQSVKTADAVPMSCPKCKDTFTTISVPSSKGMQISQTRTVAKHLCPNCATTIKTVGMGKNAKNTAVHTCNACGSTDMACCKTSKSGSMTAGM